MARKIGLPSFLLRRQAKHFQRGGVAFRPNPVLPTHSGPPSPVGLSDVPPPEAEPPSSLPSGSPSTPPSLGVPFYNPPHGGFMYDENGNLIPPDAPSMNITPPDAPPVQGVAPIDIQRGLPVPEAGGQVHPGVVNQVNHSAANRAFWLSQNPSATMNSLGGMAGVGVNTGINSSTPNLPGMAPSHGNQSANVGTDRGITGRTLSDSAIEGGDSGWRTDEAQQNWDTKQDQIPQMVKTGAGHYVRQHVHNPLGGSGYTVEKTWQPTFAPAGSLTPKPATGGPLYVPPPIRRFATGGMVPNLPIKRAMMLRSPTAPPISFNPTPPDTVPAMLSPGEAIFTPKQLKAIKVASKGKLKPSQVAAIKRAKAA